MDYVNSCQTTNILGNYMCNNIQFTGFVHWNEDGSGGNCDSYSRWLIWFLGWCFTQGIGE